MLSTGFSQQQEDSDLYEMYSKLGVIFGCCGRAWSKREEVVPFKLVASLCKPAKSCPTQSSTISIFDNHIYLPNTKWCTI